jgi:hypothetical protein
MIICGKFETLEFGTDQITRKCCGHKNTYFAHLSEHGKLGANVFGSHAVFSGCNVMVSDLPRWCESVNFAVGIKSVNLITVCVHAYVTDHRD